MLPPRDLWALPGGSDLQEKVEHNGGKKMKVGKRWLFAAWGSMIISLAAMLFVPVAVYVTRDGEVLSVPSCRW